MEKSDCEEASNRAGVGGGLDAEQDKNEATIEQSHDWRPSVREAA